LCDIDKPIVVNVEPLSLPVPLPRTQNEPERELAQISAVPATDTPVAEKV
jgi:hypothetical protein